MQMMENGSFPPIQNLRFARVSEGRKSAEQLGCGSHQGQKDAMLLEHLAIDEKDPQINVLNCVNHRK